MSTMTTLPPATTSGPPVGPPVQLSGISMRGVLRSEWVKLRSVRSHRMTLFAAAGVLVFVGLIFAGFVGGVFSGQQDDMNELVNDPAGATLRGTMLAQLIIGVLGVLVITSEYATGMIRTSLTAVPKRLPVLWAKAAVITVTTFPLMLLTSFLVFFGGQAMISSGGVATASLGDPGVLRAVVGTAAYLTGIGLMGLAVGTLLRTSAAAISTLFGAVFLLPGLGQLLLPSSWRDSVLQFLPSSAGDAFRDVTASGSTLTPGWGMAVFLAWIVVPLAVAAAVLKRRAV